jgi:hypothetical protein
MIIKFEVNGAWQIFDDVDSLMYRRMGINDCLEYREAQGVTECNVGDLIDYTETLQSNGDNKSDADIDNLKIRVLLTFMNSKQLESSQIIAFSPIYLMNNNGRTIETI